MPFPGLGKSCYLFWGNEEVLLRWDLDAPVEVQRPGVQHLVPRRAESLKGDDVASLLPKQNEGRQAYQEDVVSPAGDGDVANQCPLQCGKGLTAATYIGAIFLASFAVRLAL